MINQQVKTKKENTIYAFIDASNVWPAQKAKGNFFDFQKLIRYISNEFKGSSIKVFYYTAYPADGTRDYSLDGKHKFYTFLKKGLGFVVRKKELKRISVITEDGESIQEKGDMDVELVIDAMHHIKKYDTVVLFTGDSDFLALIAYLRKAGKKVYIFSSKNNVSEELRTGGDSYFDVLKIKDDVWGRALRHREEIMKKPSK